MGWFKNLINKLSRKRLESGIEGAKTNNEFGLENIFKLQKRKCINISKRTYEGIRRRRKILF